MSSTFDPDRWTPLIGTWAPTLLLAAIYLVGAWLVAKLVKILVGSAINRLPLVKSQPPSGSFEASVGAKLGDVAYWLVLLIGVVAALQTLGLSQVVEPLTVLMSNFFSYIPHLVGAGLIFFVGLIVAGMAQRVVSTALQATNLEGLLARVGIKTEGGAVSLANALGTLVFVLIIVPVAIAALKALQIDAISTPAIAVLSTILDAVPNVIGAGIVLTIGLLIGRWIGGVTESLLPSTGIDKAFGALQQLSTHMAIDGAPASPSASKIIGGVVTFAVVAFSAVAAAQLLHFSAIAVILTQVLTLGGKVILGAVIIAVGALIADVLGNAVAKSGEREKFAAGLVKGATLALAVAMGLKSMGIADEIVTLAFGLILGAAAVAAALAFGLGSRDAAGRLANQWVDKMTKKE